MSHNLSIKGCEVIHGLPQKVKLTKAYHLKTQIMYTDEDYIQNLIHNDPVNKWRKCIVEDLKGDTRLCESCQNVMHESCIYICDKCCCLYCIVCAEVEAFCDAGKNVYTFCTKSCLNQYNKKPITLKKCQKCAAMCRQFEIQCIDQALGQICYACVMA
jgi:hypothetical protein